VALGGFLWEVYTSNTPPLINCCIIWNTTPFTQQFLPSKNRPETHGGLRQWWVREENRTVGVQNVTGDK